ncbi:hypothetical protein JZ751_018840, partial [Albula glossodonta]
TRKETEQEEKRGKRRKRDGKRKEERECRGRQKQIRTESVGGRLAGLGGCTDQGPAELKTATALGIGLALHNSSTKPTPLSHRKRRLTNSHLHPASKEASFDCGLAPRVTEL